MCVYVYYVYMYMCMYVCVFMSVCLSICMSVCLSACMYGRPPPGPIRARGAGVIILDNYVMNMFTCPKTMQIPVKNTSWLKMTLYILIFQMEKNPIS